MEEVALTWDDLAKEYDRSGGGKEFIAFVIPKQCKSVIGP